MSDLDQRRRRIAKFKKALAKARVSKLVTAEFLFIQGNVSYNTLGRCWTVKPNGKPERIFFLDGRQDVTKYKAKRLLKTTIAKL